MAVIACPYKLSRAPSPSGSQINCSCGESNVGQLLWTYPIINHLERYGKVNRRTEKIVKSPPLLLKSGMSHIFPISVANLFQNCTYWSSHTGPLHASLNSRRGFGAPPKKTKKKKMSKPSNDDNDDDEEEEDREAGIIPEIVTNRMISRMGFSVGIPLFIGLLFFPFFYYLKVVLKIDVPTWIPFIVSFFFFGTALLGVSYGIVSSSWDPLREGSLLGWNEAQKNWPVFWQSLWGRSGKK